MNNIVFDVPLAANTQTEGRAPRVSRQMANKQKRREWSRNRNNVCES